jgi:hypothetical protein
MSSRIRIPNWLRPSWRRQRVAAERLAASWELGDQAAAEKIIDDHVAAGSAGVVRLPESRTHERIDPPAPWPQDPAGRAEE